MKTIWIVEDEKDIRNLIKRYLENEGYETRTFNSAESIRIALRDSTPDMLILDIMLPGDDGLSLCRNVRKDHDMPIIFVSARGEEFDRVLGLELGADDYLGKPFSPRELVVRVNNIFRRLNKALDTDDPHHLVLGNITIDHQKRMVTVNNNQIPFSKREFELLLMLAKNPNRPLSRNQLIESLWGYDFDGDDRVIDDTIKRIRKKIDGKGATPRLETVWGYGYKLNV